MMSRVLMLVVCLGMAGCNELACVGDSNTDPNWRGTGTKQWCEALYPTPNGWWLRNLGKSFTSVGGGATIHPEGPEQIAQAVADGAQIIVSAFITNDVAAWHRTPAQIVAAFAALKAQAGTRPFYILLAPPIIDSTYNADIAAANDALRAAYPADVIEHPAVTVADYRVDANGVVDPVHLNDAGQAKRAAAVRAKLGW